MKMVGRCRFVGTDKSIIKSGDRVGEVIYKCDISSGQGTLTNLTFADTVKAEDFARIELFTAEYDTVFEYTQKSFNGKSYTNFVVVSFSKVGTK